MQPSTEMTLHIHQMHDCKSFIINKKAAEFQVHCIATEQECVATEQECTKYWFNAFEAAMHYALA